VAESDQSKTEQPTPFRLQEARRKGQVPRSAELSGLLVMMVFSVALCATGYAMAHAWEHSFERLILMAGNAPSPTVSLMRWIDATVQPVWQALVPLVITLLVAAVVANLVQTGPVFSTEPLRPDFSRLNPAQGFKRIFSMRLLWDLFKLVFKVTLLGVLAWWLTGSLQRQVLATVSASPEEAGSLLRAVYVHVTAWVIGALAFVALLDWLFSRREYLRKLPSYGARWTDGRDLRMPPKQSFRSWWKNGGCDE
jgi:flagellar biosynthetic protein FlhB